MPKQKLPELFFDKSGRYWLSLPTGGYIALDKRDAAVHLRHYGLDPKEQHGPLDALEKAFFVAQTERAVDYAGPLAGHDCGPYRTDDGKLVLVTRGVEPAQAGAMKPTPFLERFLDELLGPEQSHFALMWLKVAHEAMTKRVFQPGQAIALAGPSACGKSFFQVVVTHVLGGRVEKCFDYLSGKTNFNKELAESEHWCIEDETASTNTGKRRDFGNAIKQATVNPLLRVHGKGLTGVTLATWRRVSISLNDEPENLMILPPLDTSLIDKIMLFKCGMATLSGDRAENIANLKRELPAFVAKLKRLTIPKSMKHPRTGVISYHNPELLEALSDIAPESRLLALIDGILKDEFRKNGSFEGSAEELEQRLHNSPFMLAVDKLLTFSSACGTYLQRLAVKYPTRFECRKVKGKTKWIVRQP